MRNMFWNVDWWKAVLENVEVAVGQARMFTLVLVAVVENPRERIGLL